MDEDIKQLLQKNLEYTKEVHAMMMKWQRRFVYQQILGVVKVIIIIVPIVFAIFYGLPYFMQAMNLYQQVIGKVQIMEKATQPAALLNIIDQLPQEFKKSSGMSDEDLKNFLK
jgi:hypothetical protein